MYFVYLLKSEKDGRTYVGYAKDVVKRLTEHNSGKVKATLKNLFISNGFPPIQNF